MGNKKLAGAVLLGTLILTAAQVQAKGEKLGFIDSERIFEKYKGTADAQKKFDDVNKEWQAKAEQMQKEVLQLKEELENQSLLLSADKKREKEALIEQKYMEMQKFVQEIWGVNGKAYRKNAELTKPITEKITAILKKIGEEEGYAYIFDASQGAIVYAESSNDLTDRVIEVLNQEAE